MREQEKERLKELGEDVESSEDQDYGSEEDVGDEVARQGLLPSVEDPKLWQVRVKKNHERMAVMALLNKCIDYQQ